MGIGERDCRPRWGQELLPVDHSSPSHLLPCISSLLSQLLTIQVGGNWVMIICCTNILTVESLGRTPINDHAEKLFLHVQLNAIMILIGSYKSKLDLGWLGNLSWPGCRQVIKGQTGGDTASVSMSTFIYGFILLQVNHCWVILYFITDTEPSWLISNLFCSKGSCEALVCLSHCQANFWTLVLILVNRRVVRSSYHIYVLNCYFECDCSFWMWISLLAVMCWMCYCPCIW